MEVAIEKCVQFWLSNKGEYSNVKGVCLLPESLSSAYALETERKKTNKNEQWEIARNHLRKFLRKKLTKGETVELTSDYDPCSEISKALRKAGLRTFLAVPCKSHTVINPITFEVWQTTVGEESKLM